MTQITQMADPDAVQLKAENGVLATLSTSLIIMIGFYTRDIESHADVLAGPEDHIRAASCCIDIVVIQMVVAYDYDVRFHDWEWIAHLLLEKRIQENLEAMIALQKKAGVP